MADAGHGSAIEVRVRETFQHRPAMVGAVVFADDFWHLVVASAIAL